MVTGMLADLRRQRPRPAALIVAGDMTAEASPGQVTRVLEQLDQWGRLGTDYFVARGNHDRPHTGAAHTVGTPVPGATDHHDCWGDVFGYRHQCLGAHQLGGLRIVALDTTTLHLARHTLRESPLDLPRALPTPDPDRPALLGGLPP